MNTMRLYEGLEQFALRLDDAADDELAERIRITMDFVWYHRLTSAQRDALNARSAPIVQSEDDVFIQPARLPDARTRPAVVEVSIPFFFELPAAAA